MLSNTVTAYHQIIQNCKEIFIKKNKDYGTSWRILRLSSITDQIYIKAKRIRTIQVNGMQKIEDDIQSEFIGIINYCIIALIQLELSDSEDIDLPLDMLESLYDQEVQTTSTLQQNKNHDYGEAWREMRISSMTDLILMKLHRVKQIEDNEGVTVISEGVDANYRDILNYAVFCLIKSNINNENAQ